MSGARITGGILSIVGGFLFIIGALTGITFLFGVFIPGLELILALIIGIVAVVGGIIGLAASKNAGGVLALVAGAIAILLCVLYFFTGLDIFGIWEYSFLTGILPFDYIILGITIEPFLILAGGITLLASSQD